MTATISGIMNSKSEICLAKLKGTRLLTLKHYNICAFGSKPSLMYGVAILPEDLGIAI